MRHPIHPESKNFRTKLTFDKKLTMANGSDTSAELNLDGASIIAITIPSSFIGSYLYFYIWDGENYVQASVPDATEDLDMVMKVLPSRAYPFVAVDFAAFQRIKVVSDSPQTSDIEFKLICRDLS